MTFTDRPSLTTQLHTYTAVASILLNKRAIVPTLAVVVTTTARSSFVDLLADQARRLGIAIRLVDQDQVRRGQMSPERVEALQNLPDTTPMVGDHTAAARARSALEALRTYARARGADIQSSARGSQAPATAWLHGVRMGRIAADIGPVADDDAVHGIFVPWPLPPGINDQDIARLVPVAKDVGGVHPGALPALLPFSQLRLDVSLARLAASLVPDEVLLLGAHIILLATVEAAAQQHPAPDGHLYELNVGDSTAQLERHTDDE